MAATMIPIQSITLTGSAASVTFSGIPQTYTDLVLRVSARDSGTAGYTNITLKANSIVAVEYVWLQGNGSAASSDRAGTSPTPVGTIPDGGSTANTFGSLETYIPNYTVPAYKQLSSASAYETNAAAAILSATATLIASTEAITSLQIDSSSNFVAGSSFHLYGIKNS